MVLLNRRNVCGTVFIAYIRGLSARHAHTTAQTRMERSHVSRYTMYVGVPRERRPGAAQDDLAKLVGLAVQQEELAIPCTKFKYHSATCSPAPQ